MPSRASLHPMPTGDMSRVRKRFSREYFSRWAFIIITILTPSFIHPLWQDEPSSAFDEPHAALARHDTAYLDGLRGIAAFVVYIFHFLGPFDRSIILGYIPGSQDSSMLGLPVLGLLRSGGAVVRIFFVISGYVLTLSASRALYIRDWDGILRSLSAAALKRGVRLFVPAVGGSFIIMLLVSAGLYTDGEVIAALPSHVTVPGPIRQASFGAQAMDWLEFAAGRLTNPWEWQYELFGGRNSYYGGHLWTIQTEFHCSLILFLVAMALSRVPTLRARGMLWAGLTMYSGLWGRWDVALFLCGMAFADVDVRSAAAAAAATADLTGQLSREKPAGFLRAGRYSRRCLAMAGYIAALVAGLWLASYPEKRGPEAVGFGLLGAIHATKEPWHAIGACLIVWSVRRIRPARALLTTSLVQYLGQVSFAFYIVHEPMLQVFGWVYTGMLRKYFILAGVKMAFSEHVGALMGMWLAFISLTPMVLIVADYAWRGLDKPSVALVRKIGRRI